MLPATVLFDFLRKDFARAWDAMAQTGFDRDVGGNFMFARQAMVLLELASRVGRADARLADFSAGIERVDPLYFWPLPGGKKWPSFGLPSSKVGGDRRSQLLPVLFDLVRHGQLHNGVQIPVRLGDGKIFGVALGGVEPGVTLDSLRREPSPMAQERPPDHLAFCKRQFPATRRPDRCRGKRTRAEPGGTGGPPTRTVPRFRAALLRRQSRVQVARA